MSYVRVVGGVVLLSITTAASGAEHHLDASFGLRTDSLRWSIAADMSGAGAPNILSELTWRDVHSRQASVGYRLTAGGFYLRASVARGWIYAGDNQDSDYAGNNRTLEFSRSNNDTQGDDLWDAAFGLGYRFRFADDALTLAPLYGRAYHEQNLRITNGRQTIPNLGSFPGLNSTYRTEWQSDWIGLELDWRFAPEVRGFFRHEWHFDAEYYARANWNLRSDFAHPVSFEHRANDAAGTVLSLGVYGPTRGRWSGSISVNWQRWEAGPGTDDVYFSDGTRARTRLNEVEWESWSIGGGVRVRF